MIAQTAHSSLSHVQSASNQENFEGLSRVTRLAINFYLDKLEKELIAKLQEACDSAKGQIMELVAPLAEKEKEILECQEQRLVPFAMFITEQINSDDEGR
jgi:hypothetical protein